MRTRRVALRVGYLRFKCRASYLFGLNCETWVQGKERWQSSVFIEFTSVPYITNSTPNSTKTGLGKLSICSTRCWRLNKHTLSCWVPTAFHILETKTVKEMQKFSYRGDMCMLITNYFTYFILLYNAFFSYKEKLNKIITNSYWCDSQNNSVVFTKEFWQLWLYSKIQKNCKHIYRTKR